METPDALIFLPSLKKKISFFDEELLLRQLSIQSNAHNYQTRAANTSNLQELSYRTESFKYPLFRFCVSELNSLQKTMRGAKSIKHFKSINSVFHIVFTMFSIHDQTDVKLLTRLRLKFSHFS